MYPELLLDLSTLRQRELRAEAGQFEHAARSRSGEAHRPQRWWTGARRAAFSAIAVATLIAAAVYRTLAGDASSVTSDSSVGTVYDVPVPGPTPQVVIDSTTFMFRTA